MIVGICGKMCSGKSVAASYLVQRGYALIDVDSFGHKALDMHKQQIVNAFGTTILDEKTRTLDRKKLASRVFLSSKHLYTLEQIVHPTMISNVQHAVHSHTASDVVIDAALLFKLNLHNLCDIVFFIDTPFHKRVQRYTARNRGAQLSVRPIHSMRSLWSALKIYHHQRDITVNNLYADVDIVVVRNNCSEHELHTAIAQYIA